MPGGFATNLGQNIRSLVLPVGARGFGTNLGQNIVISILPVGARGRHYDPMTEYFCFSIISVDYCYTTTGYAGLHY